MKFGFENNKVANMCKCTKKYRSKQNKNKNKIQRLLEIIPFNGLRQSYTSSPDLFTPHTPPPPPLRKQPASKIQMTSIYHKTGIVRHLSDCSHPWQYQLLETSKIQREIQELFCFILVLNLRWNTGRTPPKYYNTMYCIIY